MQGPFKIRWEDNSPLMYVHGPGIPDRPFTMNEENRAVDFKDMLNKVFMEGYENGFEDGYDDCASGF